MNRKLLPAIGVMVFGLQGCASLAPPQKTEAVSAGERFEGGYINVTAPHSDGWEMIQSSTVGITFARSGTAANESFIAHVMKFNLPPTNTPEDFEALIKQSVESDTDSSRLTVQQSSFSYSSERPYPCVRFHSVIQDNAPQGKKGPLLLETDGLYCRHPEQQESGFAIIYSHRGEQPYAALRAEAESFVQGIQVPHR